MDKLGAPGAGLLIALENLFPPLPSEVILPLAGFSASQGTFSLVEALLWTTIGSIAGAIALYWVGRLFGIHRLRAVVERLPLIEVKDIDKTVAWFNRHGYKAVFFGRMMPIFRSLISIPAGINHMPFINFVGLTAVGSLIWNSVFVLAGYWLGENWHDVEPYADTFQKLVIAGVVLFGIWFVITRIRRNRSGQGAAA
ncbi:MAG: DedA family protein [Chloroflexota bacterium]|nr:DedA family protein [Chloroflexota bacterium]